MTDAQLMEMVAVLREHLQPADLVHVHRAAACHAERFAVQLSLLYAGQEMERCDFAALVLRVAKAITTEEAS